MQNGVIEAVMKRKSAERENNTNDRNQPGKRASVHFKAVHDDDDDQNAHDN